MSLIKDAAIVDDPWRHLGDDDPLPTEGYITLSLARWLAERESLVGRNSPLGIRVKSNEPLEPILPDLPRFAMVALEFPAFKDGRAYSKARLLRQRHNFVGEIRAIGDVLRDQLAFMRRCGFDAFEYSGHIAGSDVLEAFTEISIVYQKAADSLRPVTARRDMPL